MGGFLNACRAAARALWLPTRKKSVSRRARRGFEPLEPRLALAADFPGLPKIGLDLRLFKPDGTELTSVAAGDNFVLKAFAADLREEPLGVFSAYLDITWDSTRATPTGPVVHSALYSQGKSGTASAGLLDEAGGFAGIFQHGGGDFEIFSVPLLALSGGPLLFEGDPADDESLEMLVHGENAEVQDDHVEYGSAFIEVGGGDVDTSFTAHADAFTVTEDSREVVLTPLANDVSTTGQSGLLTIAAVTSPNRGGSVRIAPGGSRLLYRPANNFFGSETFTYSVRNFQGEEHSAVVEVNVTEVNDPPTAWFDSFEVGANSTSNFLEVLQNDSTTPDLGETPEIVANSQGSQGGTLWYSGRYIVYQPAQGFVGLETFRYTVRDRAVGGLTSEATVEVRVQGLAAVDDTVIVENPTVPTVIDVLANDTAGSSPQEELRIVSVTPPSPDVPVSISADGKTLVFAGSAALRGVTDVVYVVTNGFGQTSSATLSLNFAAVAVVTPGVEFDGGILTITGSPGDDRLVVSLNRGRLRVAGTLDGVGVNETFAARGVRRVVAELGEGDDSLTVRPNVGAALRVDAGTGNDAVFAGLGAAVLVGGEGDDRLRGGAKRDVLIGGAGSDRILSQAANDLVIQGATLYDGDFAALDAIATEWGSKRSVNVRRTNIQKGLGPILGQLDVSLEAGLLDDEPAAVFHPLASRGRRS